MKMITIGILALLVSGITLNIAYAAEPATQPTSVPSSPSASTTDAGTNLVVSFYKLLLQEDPPTREQENALFRASSLRYFLALQQGLIKGEAPGEPMHRTAEQLEQRRLNVEKVAAEGPLLFELFRKNKELFLPKNAKSISNSINISSTMNFLCTLTQAKGPPKKGYGYVLVLFVDDRKAVLPQQRTIIFQIVDGKIDPAAIRLGGFEGKMTEEEFLK